jgi:outer membrane protein insertion porin family
MAVVKRRLPLALTNMTVSSEHLGMLQGHVRLLLYGRQYHEIRMYKPDKRRSLGLALSLMIFAQPILIGTGASAAMAQGPFAAEAPILDTSSSSSSSSSFSSSSPVESVPPRFKISAEEDVAQQAQSKGPAGNTIPGASQYVIEDIEIEGNHLIPTEEIAAVVKTKKGDTFDRDQVREDLKAINNMGYFDNDSLKIDPQQLKNGRILLKISVQENAPITQFAIKGNEVVSTDEISKIFADQLGRPQNDNALAGAISRVEQAYQQKGFVLAKVVDVKGDPDGSVELVINEGAIDNIEIVGNKKTMTSIIKGGIKVKEGEPYNEAVLTAGLKSLYNEGYFSDIRRQLVPSAANPDKYTLKVEVDEKRTASIGLGGGVDSVAGLFGSLNFSESNFRGRGQVLSFSSQVGSGTFQSLNNSLNNGGNSFLPTAKTYNIEASWIEPHLRGTNTSMAVTGFGRNMGSMFIDQAMQRTIGANINFSKPLRGKWTANLGLTGENTSLKNFATGAASESILSSMANRALATGMATDALSASAIASQYRDKQLQGATVLSISPSLVRDTRDAAVDARKGSVVKASVTPSLGLSQAFLKAGVSASKYVSPTKNLTIASNIQAGTSAGGLPQFGLYRLGGLNGLRGYNQFSSLGTGTGMLMATVEARYRLGFLSDSNKITKGIKDKVGVAFFADFGQSIGNSSMNNILSRTSMGAAVGVGLRVKMPMVGLVRLDYGLPLIAPVTGGFTPRFTVGFGEKFY